MKTIDALDVLDVLSHEAGLAEAEARAKPTKDELRDLDDLIAFARTELNRQARAEVAPVAPVTRRVRPSILAMSRDALLARLHELSLMPGTRVAALSHRAPGHSTDADLRAALEDLESLLEHVRARR